MDDKFYVMTKNIVIGVLVLLLVAEAGYFLVKRQSYHQQLAVLSAAQSRPALPPAGPSAKGKGPIMLSKGANLKTSPLFQFAYEIFPTASVSATSHMTGFTMATAVQKDGSTVVTLTPKDSQDQDQQYTVQKGQVLYFIEQTPMDDKSDNDTDLNYRDDYGIVTDASGVIQ